MNAVQLKTEESQGSAAKGASQGASSAGGLKKELRGMSFEAQEARLAPDAAVQKKATPKAEGGQAAETKVAPAKSKGGGFGATDPGNRLAGVHPTFADYVRRVIEIAHGKGLDIFVTQGMRTIAEQNALYAQGRTKKGKIVTWARGGSSYHNYGVAADFAFHGKDPYSESHDWKGLVASVREAGLISGAGYGDRPHCNIDLPMKSLQTWYAKGGMRNVWDHVSDQVGGPRFPGAEKGDGDQGNETKGPKAGGGGGAGGYVVQPGDTLIEIAERLLGDGGRWHEIADLNGIKDARELAPGKALKIPTGGATKKGDDAPVKDEGKFRQKSHTVARGETLSGIALKHYGMSSLWTEIAMANEIKDPTQIKVGQKLVIPPPGKGGPVAPKKAIPGEHMVAPGETLSAIAKAHYKDASLWKKIASANHIADPSKLKVGTKLVIPM